jgi:hypothetical protein
VRSIRPISLIVGLVFSVAANAHDPVFAPGPHTLFKGGVEIHVGAQRVERDNSASKEYETALLYGITGDWVAGIELPYEQDAQESGVGDVSLITKYRFWRDDQFRAQESAAVLARVKLDSGGETGTGSTDALLGITYGYEGLKWYRWAAARYRYNGKDDNGLKRGDKLFLDAVVGIRPRKLEYRAPDAVWMLELNAEWTDRAERNGGTLANTGGTEIFLSPGLMWTWRNFAIKPGVQIPIYDNLNGNQPPTDYRAVIGVEVHL